MAGIYHNLDQIFERLNERYFQNQITAAIRWGMMGKAKRRSRVAILLGSYHTKDRAIRIHPALDQAIVPRICIERVVHHEMLHQKHSAIKRLGGKRCIHTPEFKRDEALFSAAEIADAWFKQNLDKILRFGL